MHDCVFCKIVLGDIPSWKVLENEYTYAFFDINPVSKYHTLVIPKHHYRDIFSTPDVVLKEMISTTKTISTLYKEKLQIQNIQIINNSGLEAQQDVFHIHFHVIPRHKDDGQDIQQKPKPDLNQFFPTMLQRLQ